MRVFKIGVLSFLFLALLGSTYEKKEASSLQEKQISGASQLVVLWTSRDRDVALNMVFMYTLAAKKNGWWDEIRFIIWGPSSKLLSEDEELQLEIKKMKEAGVELLACKVCAERYGVSEKLEKIGIEVKLMGGPLTSMLKTGWVCLTF